MMTLNLALKPRLRSLALGSLALLLAGCASVNIDRSVAQANRDAAAFTNGQLQLQRDAQARDAARTRADQLLATPLSQAQAVQLALLNSPALQALLAERWGDMAAAAQAGRIPNPLFRFERSTLLDERELNRSLSFGLLDLLTLPLRQAVAQKRLDAAQLALTANVVDEVTRVRQAWVNAVAAQQSLGYARQVAEAAQAGAELAQRMQQAGNFNRLQRARQQVFYADAVTRVAVEQQSQTATREALVRLLGLDDAQAAKLKLPERLADLPKAPREGDDISRKAMSERLDIRIAALQADAAAQAQGLGRITSFTDVEAGVRRDAITTAGATNPRRGYELGVRLPLFDWGGVQRDAFSATTLAAANRLDATMRSASSQLREAYAGYRNAYDIARHYRDEVVPLRKTISDENQLLYNGMFISVFELLADARDQVSTVLAAQDAERQFWLADAALQSAVIGRPFDSPAPGPAAMSSGSATAAAH